MEGFPWLNAEGVSSRFVAESNQVEIVPLDMIMTFLVLLCGLLGEVQQLTLQTDLVAKRGM